MSTTLQKLLDSNCLPSLPEVAMRVLRIAQQPEPDLEELVRVIKADPALSGRVLKTTNSALFGLPQRISSIEAAIPILGANMIRTLVLGFTLADYRGPQARYRVYFQRLWRGCVTQAVVAEMLAQRNPSIDPAIWFLAALLQDIGRLAMLAADSEEYSRLIGLVDDGPELLESERRTFGYTHADVSVQLCMRWRMDEAMVDAVARHHVWIYRPAEPLGDAQWSDLGVALRCAAMTADYFEGLRCGRTVSREQLENAFKQGFQVDAAELNDLLSEVDQRVGEIAALFLFDIGEFQSIDELLAQAHAALAEIAVVTQVEMAAAKRHMEEAKRELDTIRSETDELREQAQKDALTGAFTRRFLEPYLERELQRAARSERRVGVLFMDVDRFKKLNDQHGHSLGDEVLRKLVQALRVSLRDSDSVIRYGGDEFVVILSLNSVATLSRVAERILARVTSIRCASEPSVRVSSSIGALLCHPTPTAVPSCETVLDEVDRAMYVAKQRGGDRIAIFTLRGNDKMASELQSPPRPNLLDEDVWSAELELA